MSQQSLTSVITSVSSQDIKQLGFDPSALSQSQLDHVASKMADMYIEDRFWDDLAYQCQTRNLPKLDE